MNEPRFVFLNKPFELGGADDIGILLLNDLMLLIPLTVTEVCRIKTTTHYDSLSLIKGSKTNELTL